MPLKPTYFRQERVDTCAIACLRMVLAAFGIDTTEDELVDAATMEEGGLDIVELMDLARLFGLAAIIRQLDAIALTDLLASSKLAIVYLNRLPIDRVFSIHAVVPIRVTTMYVTCLDPLRGERRVSRQKFAKACSYLNHFAVVCESAS